MCQNATLPLRLKLQDKQISPFYSKTGCVSVCSLCCTLEVVGCRSDHNCNSSEGHRNTVSPGHHSQVIKRQPMGLSCKNWITRLICPKSRIPEDNQGANTDAKNKEPLFEIARAQSHTCANCSGQVQEKESKFQNTQRFYGILGRLVG